MPEFGMGLDGLVGMRSADLVGIVNGIDTDVWDPANDPLLAANYTAKSMKGRAVNRRAVEERFSLEHDESPLLCVVSRLTWQKGMDILAAVLDGVDRVRRQACRARRRRPCARRRAACRCGSPSRPRRRRRRL